MEADPVEAPVVAPVEVADRADLEAVSSNRPTRTSRSVPVWQASATDPLGKRDVRHPK